MLHQRKKITLVLFTCLLLLLAACSNQSTAGKEANPTSTSASTNSSDTANEKLKILTFNPGENSVFAITSSLIEGPNEVLLVDAQFQKNDAEHLVQMIRDTGKKLTAVYISHQDPDYYFGLSVIRDAFPDVKIVATEATVEGIKQTIQIKNDYWNPILGENAPTEQIIPDVLDGDQLTVDGESIQIVGLDGPDPAHTFLWVPSLKTVLGGVVVTDNGHVWLADNQTVESRDNWRTILDSISALNPARVIPGHYLGESSENIDSVNFTRDYIAKFEAEASQAANSAQLIEAMKKAYPSFTSIGDLETSAQVIKGEMAWP